MNDEKMSEAEIFAKVIKLRNIFKDLNQLTWAIREVEQKFPIQTASKDLLNFYKEFAKDTLEIGEKVKEATK